MKLASVPLEKIEIIPVRPVDYPDLAMMVGELLNEIMLEIDQNVFNYDQKETEERILDLIGADKYWVFIAKDTKSNSNIGFVSLYESYALYSQGAFGTLPELYIRPDWRSQGAGKYLLNKVSEFSRLKNWQRVEVTTPPLPAFERTLEFYKTNGFVVSGGKKLKIDIT